MRRVGVSRSTYTEGDLATFGHLFGKNSEEIQNGGVALGLVAQGRYDQGKYVLPLLHLNSQYCKADAKLDSDRFGARCIHLEELQ
jgi:hypothetical protein